MAMFCAMVVLLIFSETNAVLKNLMLGLVTCTNAAAIVSYLYIYFIKQKQFKNYLGKYKAEELKQ